jgi:hypothetical protein
MAFVATGVHWILSHQLVLRLALQNIQQLCFEKVVPRIDDETTQLRAALGSYDNSIS